ncbi:MAG: hypothetical protein KJZ53_04165 [Anaerolineales bacterium]|nr:hypothetical protein [Anaerolineales bacterium]
MRAILSRLPALLLAFAAICGVVASLLVFFTAGATQVSTTNGVETVTQLTWLQAQGWWGVVILIIFSALFAAPWFFYGRGQRRAAGVFIATAVLLTLLATLSIGIFYWLASLAALLGGAAMLLQPRS